MTNRRTLLRSLATVAGVSMAGCSEIDPASEEPTSRPRRTESPIPRTTTPDEVRSEFDRVVNVVDAGADPEGTRLIDDVLHAEAADDTLLYFPPGRYRVGQVRFENRSRFGLIGDDATLIPDVRGRNVLLNFYAVTDLHVEGFHVDSTAENTLAWTGITCVGGDNTITDYTVEGFGDVSEPTFGLTLTVQGSDTTLVVNRVDLSDGAERGIATFVFPRREFPDPNQPPGTLTFRDCVMKGWGGEGLYASAHSGPVSVVGGEYANNAIDQVRVGGGNASNRALIRDVSVSVSRMPPYTPPSRQVMRGIWLKEGDGVTIENCHVSLDGVAPTQTTGAIVLNEQFGRATIRDTTVTTSVSRPAVVAASPASQFDPQQMPSLDHLPSEWGVECENLRIESTAADTPGVLIVNRENCSLRGVDIHSAGSGGDGVRLRNVENCRISDAAISATRYPVIVVPNSSTPCGLSLRGSSLRSSGESDSTLLTTSSEGRFCLTPSFIADLPGEGRALALVGTEATDDRTENPRASDTEQSLYGRRTTHWW